MKDVKKMEDCEQDRIVAEIINTVIDQKMTSYKELLSFYKEKPTYIYFIKRKKPFFKALTKNLLLDEKISKLSN